MTECIGHPMAFRIALWVVLLALVAAVSSLRARSSAPWLLLAAGSGTCASLGAFASG
jgi:hypothetical protein